MARVITVDFEGVETGGMFVRVPEGDYGVKVAEVKTKKSGENKPYLSVMLELTKGNTKGVGKTIIHSCSLQKQALWNLRSLLEACGKKVPSKAVKLDLDKMAGWECAATLVDDEYEGKKKSVVSAFFPLSDLGSTSNSGKDLDEASEEAEETGEETESTEEEDLFN